MIMDLRIISNPHLEPETQKQFVSELMNRRRVLRGIHASAKLDQGALDRLKEQLRRESKSAIQVN